MSFAVNEGMLDDLIKKRVDRISKIFPPCTLAYSFLLKSNNFRLSIDELYNQMMLFPQVPDARKIFISPDDTKLFDFQDVNLFQISISKFISLDEEELTKILNNYYFNVSSNEVCILNPPEIDINKTLLIFRHLYPEMSESDMIKELDRPIFIAYFHYHRLEFDPEINPIPELQPPESFYYFDHEPSPEQALLSIFCANRTDQMNLVDLLQIKRKTEIYIGPENTAYISTIIGDIYSLVENSHIFYFVDNTIQVYPPLVLSNNFDYKLDFLYHPNENPCLVYSPDNENEIYVDESSSNDALNNSLYPYIERILEDIGSNVPNFTFSQIFEHVAAQRIGCDQFIFGENEVSIDDIKDAISRWVTEHTENGVISKIQQLENDNRELLEQRRLSLASDRKSNDLLNQMLDEYPFLKQDSLDLEQFYAEIRQNQTGLYKLKGT